MHDTGERDDVGVFTENQADYIMCEDARALATVRAWLEGSGSIPWHHRDENAHGPIDFVNTYPKVSSYNNGQYGSPAIPASYDYGSSMSPDTTHEPTLGYLPFLLTGDPYALEEIQFTTTFDYIHFGGEQLFGLDNATRAYAQHIRNIAHCVVCSPVSPPSWIKSKAYWQTYVARALTVSLTYGPNQLAGSIQGRFHHIGYPDADDKGNVSGGQEEYVGVYLHVVDLGMPGWDAMRDWKIQSNIARTNGTSGYNRSIPNTYIRAEQAGSPAAPAFADWAAMWNHNYTKGNASEYFVKADLTQAHMPAAIGNFAFITMTAGNLNWAARQGVPNTSGSRTWLNHEMAGRWAYQKWAIS